MYKWYYNARVCYAYLSDFTKEEAFFMPSSDQLTRCRWFSRGWTLQELIAPSAVFFFDKSWTRIAGKTQITSVLAEITNIDEEILVDRDKLYRASVAKRMSWAAERKTLQLEDQAYSLLGLFDINMPLLYGEGLKAFKRLQEEIIRTWSRVDHSLIAWHGQSDGLLASSPSQFPVYFPEDSPYSSLKRDIISWSLPQNEVFELSNQGLRISLYARCAETHQRSETTAMPWHREPDVHAVDRLIVTLNCTYRSRRNERFALFLTRRPYIASGVRESPYSADAVQKSSIFDFEPQYGLVPEELLKHFTPTTLTIARYRWIMPASLLDVHIESNFVSEIHVSSVEGPQIQHENTCMSLSFEAVPEESATSVMLIEGVKAARQDLVLILLQMYSKTHRDLHLQLPVLMTRLYLRKDYKFELAVASDEQDALAWDTTAFDVLTSGSSVTLYGNPTPNLPLRPLLRLHGRYVLLGGRIIWETILEELQERSHHSITDYDGLSRGHAFGSIEFAPNTRTTIT